MIWALLAAVVGAASVGGMIYASRRARLRHPPALVAADLSERVAAAARAFAVAEPWLPSSTGDAPAAAAVEAALIAGDAKRALEAAEAAVAAEPGAAAPRVWLAWALIANAQPRAALRVLDANGASDGPDGPLAMYVRARAEHQLFEHGSGAIGALPPLITTADLAIVTLARGKGSAAWLAGSTDLQLSSDQVRAAMGEHRETTARCLAAALDALAAAPGFADAAYLVARLAVKAGAVGPARPLFDALAPRIAGRPDADAFARDRADLEDPSRAVTAAKQPPVTGTAKRSTRLKVLP